MPQTAESYFSDARELLARIAELTARARGLDAGSEATLFLEKTPHSLLAIAFLARLAPGARFLHVMRDPRAIALSLLAMPWGPDRLPAAARWVASYCRAWAAAEAEAAALGIPLLRLHIEDAVSAPGPAAAWLTERLDIGPHDRLFAGASPEVLNRGAARAGAEERALLDRALGGWAAHFGYEAKTIGRRLNPDFGPALAPEAATKTEPA